MLDNSKKMYGWVRRINGDSKQNIVEIYYEGVVICLKNVQTNNAKVGDFVEVVNSTVYILNKKKNTYDNCMISNPFLEFFLC